MYLAPVITDVNAPFWDAAERDELVLPFCRKSGRFFWPPGPVSPFDPRTAVEWRAAPPSGILAGVVVYRRVFQKVLSPVMPYGVGLLALGAGPRLLVHLPAPDLPRSPRTGDAVTLYFAPILTGAAKIPMASRDDAGV